jgi:hypothetical protein
MRARMSGSVRGVVEQSPRLLDLHQNRRGGHAATATICEAK